MNNLEIFRRKLADGHVCIGIGIGLSDPLISELVGELGYDFTFIDMEHGMFDLRTTAAHLIALRGSETAALVRVPSSDPVLMKPILDLHPAGIIVPQIQSAAEAQRALSATFYPPRGELGYGPLRGLRYGLISQQDYPSSCDLFRVLQIEHLGAVAEADEILLLEGLDGVLIGPNDLSGSIGKLGHTDDPGVMSLIDDVSRKVVASGKHLGTSTGFSEASLKQWLGRGLNFISLEGDIGNLFEASRSVLNAARSLQDA